MTDREVLLIAYGALKADGPANVAKFVEAHLFPAQDKPSELEPSASIEIIAPPNWPARPNAGSGGTYAGEHVNNCTTPVREPGTPGVDRPLKRSDCLK